nr:hypothetical protein [Bacillus sp. AFS088145]
MDKIRLEMDTHFFGTLSMISAFAPKMENNGGGTIFNSLPLPFYYSHFEQQSLMFS